MNPIVEREIVHVGKVMRASILRCAPQTMLIEYWRHRIGVLISSHGLAELQRHALLGMLNELDALEKQLDNLCSDSDQTCASGSRGSRSGTFPVYALTELLSGSVRRIN